MHGQAGKQDEAEPGMQLPAQRMLHSQIHPLIPGTLAPKPKLSYTLAEAYKEGRWWK